LTPGTGNPKYNKATSAMQAIPTRVIRKSRIFEYERRPERFWGTCDILIIMLVSFYFARMQGGHKEQIHQPGRLLALGANLNAPIIASFPKMRYCFWVPSAGLSQSLKALQTKFPDSRPPCKKNR
jgi:hypothetical protein